MARLIDRLGLTAERRRRDEAEREARLAEQRRVELTELHASFTSALHDGLATMRSDVDAVRTEQARRARVEHVERAELTDAVHELARALDRLARSIESDRRDRQAVATTRVLGGTIDLTTDAIAEHEPTALVVGDTVEVRSHFHEGWSPGFRVAAVLDDGECRRYRLTRRSDGTPLPTLFDAHDVRESSAPTPAH